jgi:hypothetical protein
MGKRILCVCLAALLALTLTIPALAAPGLNNFQESRSYEGQFEDVADDAWYYEYVAAAYTYGLIEGKSETSFAPDDDMSVAEVIALAARVHNMYYGGGDAFSGGSPWYAPYVDYAAENGIIRKANAESSYTRAALRYEVAHILCNAVPATALPAINSLEGVVIPDLNGGGYASQYSGAYEQISRLYAAGVLTGCDEYGSFQGRETVKRSEVAGVLCRIVDAGLRVTYRLPEPLTTQEILINGYWTNYGVTNGTSGVYRFFEDGTYMADFLNSRNTGTYTLEQDVLNIDDGGFCYGEICRNMLYDAVSGVFGRNKTVAVQGMQLDVDALCPITRADYEGRVAAYEMYGNR